MAYGLSVVNDDGNIQIDSAYKTLVLAETHSVTSVTADYDFMAFIGRTAEEDGLPLDLSGSSVVVFNATFSTAYDTKPIIGYKSTAASACIYTYITNGSGQFTGVTLLSDRGSAGSSATVYVMTDDTSITPSGYGLAVYNSGGHLTYSSDNTACNVVSVNNITIYGYFDSDGRAGSVRINSGSDNMSINPDHNYGLADTISVVTNNYGTLPVIILPTGPMFYISVDFLDGETVYLSFGSYGLKNIDNTHIAISSKPGHNEGYYYEDLMTIGGTMWNEYGDEIDEGSLGSAYNATVTIQAGLVII